MLDYWRELIIDSKVIPTTQNPRKSGATFLGTGDLLFGILIPQRRSKSSICRNRG